MSRFGEEWLCICMAVCHEGWLETAGCQEGSKAVQYMARCGEGQLYCGCFKLMLKAKSKENVQVSVCRIMEEKDRADFGIDQIWDRRNASALLTSMWP